MGKPSDQQPTNDSLEQGSRPNRTGDRLAQIGAELKAKYEPDVRAYQVAEISGLDIEKLVTGTYGEATLQRQIKGALGERTMQESLQGQYGSLIEHEPIYLKPEETLDEANRLALYGKRPDAVVFSGAGADHAQIAYVLDAKAWSANFFESHNGQAGLRNRAEAYADLPELARHGVIMFAVPNDLFATQAQRIQEIKSWNIRGHTVDVIPLGKTNAELDGETQSIIRTLQSWRKPTVTPGA